MKMKMISVDENFVGLFQEFADEKGFDYDEWGAGCGSNEYGVPMRAAAKMNERFCRWLEKKAKTALVIIEDPNPEED